MTSTVSRPQIAILDDYQGVALSSADWSAIQHQADITVYRDTILDEDLLVQRLLPFHIICTMRERTKFPESVLTRLPNLRFISTTGPRNASIDVEFAKQRGVTVSGTGGKGNSTVEHIWALIMAVTRRIAEEDRNTRARNPHWQTFIPTGLAGKTLGLIGLGRLGSAIAKIAKLFEMRIIAWSPNLTLERATAQGVEFAGSKENLLRHSDIVSVHLVLSEQTRGVITAEDLALLKPTAFFINTSRGPLVNEQGLVKVLKEGKVAGAGLDVFDVEPLPLEHPFRDLPNVTLSPHNGYVNDTNYSAFYGDTVGNVEAFLEGKAVRVIG